MAVRDSVVVVSRAKKWIKRSLRIIDRAMSVGALTAVERERRFLNALGLNSQSQILRAVERGIEDEARTIAEEEALEFLVVLEETQELRDRIDKVRALRRRLRQTKLGDQAVRNLARDRRFGKARTVAEYTEQSMEFARDTHTDTWTWTANESACAACLSLHGSQRRGNFSPLHPNCLCIPEVDGPSRKLTDDEIADQMIQRGGRDAKLGRALKSGEISRDQIGIRRRGITKQRNFNIPDVAGPTAHYRNADFLEAVGSAEAESFYGGFAQAKQGRYGGFLGEFDQAHFEGDNVRTYTAFDGKVGAALTDHGDGRIEIGSLFADPDAPDGAGRDMLRYLVRERDGNFLTNFDGPLTEFYREEGFEVISRSPFNPEFAPEGWDYELFGTPDYVEMAKVK